MKRRTDWLDQMWSTIEQHQQDSFDWGSNDCCSFAAKIVDAMCDSNFAEQLAEKYTDQDSAIKYIIEEGGIEAAVSKYLGKSKTGRAQRGDVVMFDGALGDTLGICVGSTIAAISESGVIYMPRSATICYWTI